MTTITSHFGIAGPVPFEDIHVDVDNRVFLDPHAIRLQGAPAPHAASAVRCIDSFFDTLARLAMSPSKSNHNLGEAMLRSFPEPWETRCGLSSNGYYGHGGAADVGSWIWEALTQNLEVLLRVGVLKHLEDLPLFVDGIDKDITSDITTRIVYVALAEFTSEMIARFPEFRRGPNATVAKRVQMWDPLALSWTTRTVNVPSVNGAPLLLIPRGWGRPQLMMSAQRYYATSLLSYVQVEQAITTSRGKVLYLPKGQLRAQPALAPSRRTNVAVTRRAIEKSDDLVEVFKRFVLSKYERVERESLAG